MKKLIIILFLFCGVLYSQTDTLGQDTISLTTIYNNGHGTSITSMSTVCDYYRAYIYPSDDTSSIKIGYDVIFDYSFRSHDGVNDLGWMKASSQPDLWFRSWYALDSVSQFQYTVKFEFR